MTPMAYSTANWHWKNKTVTPWAREWFERELVTIQVEGSDGAVVSVERVISVDGDVELGRRKSKYVRAFSTAFPTTLLRVAMCEGNHPVQLRGRIFTFVKAQTALTARLTRMTCRLITIYDCKVVLQWKGATPDGTEAKGELTIPEVSHDITLDGISDYVVCASLYICREPWLH